MVRGIGFKARTLFSDTRELFISARMVIRASVQNIVRFSGFRVWCELLLPLFISARMVIRASVQSIVRFRGFRVSCESLLPLFISLGARNLLIFRGRDPFVSGRELIRAHDQNGIIRWRTHYTTSTQARQ
jgi:hypothetical protein